MRRRPNARPLTPPRAHRTRSDDRAFHQQLAALRADYLRIAPDPAFVDRVGARIAALTAPVRARRRRRALGLAATVLLAFLSGYVSSGGGGGERFWGRGGATSAHPSRTLSSGAGGLVPMAQVPPTAPVPRTSLSPPTPQAPPTTRASADRLRALLAPLGTPAATDPATLAAWRRATRDPDPTLRAVARALLRATGSPDGAESRAPPTDAAGDPDDPPETPRGVQVVAPLGEAPR